MASPGSEQSVTVDGHVIKLTNLDKILYPVTGTTKADVIGYYAEIAAVMLPQVIDRPATRKRWPDGVGDGSHEPTVFFNKDLAKGTPDWVTRFKIAHRDHDNFYPAVNDLATLTWLGQLAALEIHVPQWRFGANGQPRNPDRLVLDLDPGEGVSLAECAEVARWAQEILTDIGHAPVPVTSGSKGIHLYAPLDGSLNSDQATEVARELARALEADHPDTVTATMKRSLRAGKVFLDWSQNNGSKTTVSPYSLRGRLRPTVAAPRTWDELADPDLAQLEYAEVLERIAAGSDPLAAMAGPAPAVVDRLTTYRSMRDPAKTPEPVPSTPPSGGPRIHRTGRHVRHPGAPRPSTALRLPAGARRRPGQLGRTEGSTDRHRRQPPRRPDRGPPAGVRHLRRLHPAGRVRRRLGRDLGLRHLRAAQVARRQGGDRHPARPGERWARRPGALVRAHPHRGRQQPAGEELADAPDDREADVRSRRPPRSRRCPGRHARRPPVPARGAADARHPVHPGRGRGEPGRVRVRDEVGRRPLRRLPGRRPGQAGQPPRPRRHPRLPGRGRGADRRRGRDRGAGRRDRGDRRDRPSPLRAAAEPDQPDPPGRHPTRRRHLAGPADGVRHPRAERPLAGAGAVRATPRAPRHHHPRRHRRPGAGAAGLRRRSPGRPRHQQGARPRGDRRQTARLCLPAGPTWADLVEDQAAPQPGGGHRRLAARAGPPRRQHRVAAAGGARPRVDCATSAGSAPDSTTGSSPSWSGCSHHWPAGTTPSSRCPGRMPATRTGSSRSWSARSSTAS